MVVYGHVQEVHGGVSGIDASPSTKRKACINTSTIEHFWVHLVARVQHVIERGQRLCIVCPPIRSQHTAQRRKFDIWTSKLENRSLSRIRTAVRMLSGSRKTLSSISSQERKGALNWLSKAEMKWHIGSLDQASHVRSPNANNLEVLVPLMDQYQTWRLLPSMRIDMW